MKYVWILSFFFFPLWGLPITLRLVDRDSERVEETIVAILKIQKSLLLSLEATEMPSYAQTGFLTIRMTNQYLLDFLQTGKFLLAFHHDQLVGYLLLDKIDHYLKWAHGKQFKSKWDLQALHKIAYIDQIAVIRHLAKQGIGTALVDYAKMLSPHGLLTDILYAPYSNQASMRFFAAQKFVELGIMQVEKTVAYPEHATSVMLWLPN